MAGIGDQIVRIRNTKINIHGSLSGAVTKRLL